MLLRRMAWVAIGSVGLMAIACVGGGGSLPDPTGDPQGASGVNVSADSPPRTTSSTSGSTGASSGASSGGSGVSSTSSGSTGTTSTSSGGTRPPPPPMAVSDYSRSCTQPSDCVAVYVGAVCNPCFCPNAAITVSDKSRYDTTWSERRSQCTLEQVECAACAPSYTRCTNNQCSWSTTPLPEPPQDAGNDVKDVSTDG